MMNKNLSFSHFKCPNESLAFLDNQNESVCSNVSAVLCEEDVLDMQSRKLTVLSTISILTLISNVAIMVAILKRNKKVRS